MKIHTNHRALVGTFVFVLAVMLAFVSRASAQSLAELKQQYQQAKSDVNKWQTYLDTTDFQRNIDNAQAALQTAQDEQSAMAANRLSLELQAEELQNAVNNYDPSVTVGDILDQIEDLQSKIDAITSEIENLWPCVPMDLNDERDALIQQMCDLMNADSPYNDYCKNLAALQDIQDKLAIADGKGVAAAQSDLDNAEGDHDYASAQLTAAITRKEELASQILMMGGTLD